MADPNYSVLFNCPKCGKSGSIYLVKVAGTQIIVKQRCPDHGGRQFKIPLMRKDGVIPLFHDGFFRCFKCGAQAPVANKRNSGPWTLIRLNCPTHGVKIPELKIWGTVYSEVTQNHGEGPGGAVQIPAAPQPVAPAPVVPEIAEKQPTPTPEKKFCPNCGTPLEGIEAFCGTCGAEID